MTATTINRFEYERTIPKSTDFEFFDQNYPPSVLTLRTNVNGDVSRSWDLPFRADGEEQPDHANSSSGQIGNPAALGATWNGSLINHFDATATIRAPPRTPAEQQAFAYLINCYLDVPPQSLDPGYLDVLNLVIRRQNRGNCLETCLSTLALAAFSRRPASRSATVDTQASYSVALQAVNGSIGNPKSIYDDELLASVIVLALVECLIGDNVNGYYNHLYGAMTILKSRGQRKFHDDLGAELFMLLRHELFRSSAIRFLEPQGQYPYDWAMSVMEIVDDPSVERAQAATLGSRQNRLISYIHKMFDEYLVATMSSSPVHSLLTVPSVFASDPVVDNLVDSDPNLASTIKEYLQMASNAFSVTEISGHSIEDFYPQPCDVQPVSNNEIVWPGQFQGYTWKSREYANLGLCLVGTRLFGYNVAAKVFEKARLKDPSIDTTEFEVIAQKAREAIEIIVGSGPYICSPQDIDGVGSNDYMWLHQCPPFLVAMESPFATAEQRRIIEPIFQYTFEVKGIRMAGAVLNQYRQFQRESAANHT
ncbi:hypothetical protein PFICI_02915 [Pestalotiopsis fici W106-1]|uniref:Transcription factor domain-containing protein n=1 Tax=Pestalotiopsis fici (strain W106-1 / CGMCC3.15140) TaxID=1229662 RepID=W3XFT2_PESFW|nr:uncharacterized protein PFICI_02915 [Pestalotiopsis fici W106-1]ETS84890.1 hypothetical protein PFICI_02915 [Pestalotiopsis fici W106-1]